MPSNLPYLAAPGSIKSCLEKIKTAATPERVTADFVSTILKIKGGTGRALIPYLKKIGFVAPDGAPTDLYKRFRNHSSAGAAAASAVKIGYKPLSAVNEFFYELGDKDLLALINQVTGAGAGDKVAKLTLATLLALRSFADFASAGEAAAASTETASLANKTSDTERVASNADESRPIGINLGYTINLHLPATSDPAVFNAIFKSLREHLLSSHE